MPQTVIPERLQLWWEDECQGMLHIYYALMCQLGLHLAGAPTESAKKCPSKSRILLVICCIWQLAQSPVSFLKKQAQVQADQNKTLNDK